MNWTTKERAEIQKDIKIIKRNNKMIKLLVVLGLISNIVSTWVVYLMCMREQ